MGLQLIVPNVSFTNNLGFVNYPQQAALSSLFFLGGTEAESKINRAYNGVDAIGLAGATTVVQPHYMTFSGAANANHFKTNEKDATADFTMCAVIRPVTTALSRGIMSNYTTAFNGAVLSVGSLFTMTNASSGLQNVVYKNAPYIVGGTSTFYFIAMTLSGRAAQGYSGIDNILTPGAATTLSFDRSTLATTDMVIGGLPAGYGGSSYADSMDIAMVAWHKAAMTAAEIDYEYQYAKAMYAALGITVK